MRSFLSFSGFARFRTATYGPSSTVHRAAIAIGTVLILLVTTAWSESAFAESNVTRKGNNLTLTCDREFSPPQTLCQNGDACQNLPAANPPINPPPASNTGQDNIFFSTLPTDVMWEVTQRTTTVTLPSGGTKTSADPVRLTISGPPTVPSTPRDIASSDGTVMITQNGVGSSPVQIRIGTGNPQDFGVLQYRVKCDPSPPPPPNTARITLKKLTDIGDGNFKGTITANSPPNQGPYTLDLDTISGEANAVQDVMIESSMQGANNKTSFTVTETLVDPNYTFVDINCVIFNKGNPSISSALGPNLTLTAGATATCTIRNELIEETGLLIEKSADPDKFTAEGDVITYSYKVTNTGNTTVDTITVTDSLGFPINCIVTELAPLAMTTCTGTYKITKDNLDQCRVENEAFAEGVTKIKQTPVMSEPVQLAITCTTDRTRELIRSFINRRVDLLASNEPDRPRMLRRFNRFVQPSGSTNATPMQLMGKSDGGATQFKFATSLSQIAQANRAAEQKKIDGVAPMGLGGKSFGAPAYVKTPGVDVWVEGHFQRFDDELGGNDQDGDFGILWVGADYLVSRSFLIGALVQFDWMDQQTPSLDDAEVRGRGWLAGPYATVKLSEHLLFDTRAAWGQSDNDITPFGTYTDSFDTERWLAKANLTGNWNFGHLYVTPSVGVIYVEEESETYVDSMGATINGQTVRLGRLTFGPEFRYKSYGADGSILEPHISFTGMWDFDEDDDAGIANVGGLLVSDDDFRVKIEAGLLAHNPNFSAASFRGTVSYDGLGDNDFSAWGGQLWVNWPLN